MKSLGVSVLVALVLLLVSCAQPTNSTPASLKDKIVGTWVYDRNHSLGFDSDGTYHELGLLKDGSPYNFVGQYATVEPDKINITGVFQYQRVTYSFFNVAVSGNQLTLSQASGNSSVTVTMKKQ